MYCRINSDWPQLAADLTKCHTEVTELFHRKLWSLMMSMKN